MSDVTSAAVVGPSLLQRLLASDDSAAEPIAAWRQAYRDAAAVLASFEPLSLLPFGHEPVPQAWHKLLADCEPVDAPVAGSNRWRLRDRIRHDALLGLRDRGELAQALHANPERALQDPLQIAIERLIDGQTPALLSMTREQLAALAVACEWFAGIVAVPSEAELRAALPIAEILTPLRQLADGFVGRESELARLEDFVGALDARSIRSYVRRAAQGFAASVSGRVPLFVHGPGGIGKSTLIARFVLEHVEVATELRLPFAYLDIDRAAIDPQRPLTLLLEAMAQLRVQFPAQADTLTRMADDLRATLARFDTFEADKSYDGSQEAIARFADWLQHGLAHETRQPLMLVVDTFEEVQFLGPSAVQGVWQLLMGLQTRVDELRIVVAGRAFPRELECKSLALAELDTAGARALLQRRLMADGQDATALPSAQALDEIVAIVGRSPMSLRFAAQVVSQQGLAQLRTVETRSFLFLHIRAEKVQAQLYGRILSHIHDPSVRKLAFPGLVVRRITPGVIREVLAGPCEVPLPTPDSADALFGALARELALFEPDDADPQDPADPQQRPLAVRHRLDVRRMMLRDLLSSVPAATVRRIDQAAVDYYVKQPGPRARAEEIYHRLRLGQPLDEVDARWMVGVGEHLRTALEELPPRSRLWLTTRLGATPPTELLAQADLSTWEENVARDAQRALQSGNPTLALELMSGRNERSAASPLYRLEAETRRTIGDNPGARACAQRGIEAASAAGARGAALDLHLLVAAIDEGEGALDAALARLEAARPLVDAEPGDEAAAIDALRLLTARIRVRRLLGPAYDHEREELSTSASARLTPQVLRELRSRPALLRELVAELGDRHLELMRAGLDVVGLELGDAASQLPLLDALADWGRQGGKGNPVTQVLASSHAQAPSGRIDWPLFADALGGPTGIAQLLLKGLVTDPTPTTLIEALTAVYRAAVAASVRRKPS